MELTIGLMCLCFCVFCISGFIDSIAGGGGLINIPFFLLCDVPPHYALGTSRFSTSLGTLTSVWTFARNHFVVVKIIPIGFTASFIGAAFGAWCTYFFDSAQFGKILIFLLPVGFLISLAAGKIVADEGELPTKGLWIKVIITAFVIGAYDGFFGPGTGSFFIIAQRIFLNMNLVKASATAKVFNFASNLGSLCVFAGGGTVYYLLGLPCVAGSILGNQLGTRLAIKLGSGVVKKFLYLTLTLLLVSLVIKFFIK